MKRWILTAAALLVLLPVGGFLGAASGVVPIKASSGHFAITEWFLQFSKRRSLATHTLGLELPSLDDRALVLKGAGHYETGCRPCHGSPELRHPRVARAMTPPPPYLPPQIAKWEPEELFYIVKHGIKFTGMPAWPAQQRDDEVHAMVAFLLAFPALDAGAYRQLVFGAQAPRTSVAPLPDLRGAPDPPRAVLASCARCHGVDGNGRGIGAFPKLSGQRREYLHSALQAYARDERHSGIMQPIAAALSAGEMAELAEYYAGLPGLSANEDGASVAAAAEVERGREIATHGIPGQRVPSCMDCHGPAPRRKNPHYPRLAGQYAEYLVLQLQLFDQRQRGGSRYAHLMHKVAPRLGAQQMRDVAAYYASLRASSDPAGD
jgi:cytochrome c553